MIDLNLSDHLIQSIADFRKKNSPLFSKWHSLSLKAMNEIMSDLWETSQNQMQIFTQLGVFQSNSEAFKGLKYIPVDAMVDEIYNPVVRNSIRESIKIINALLKKYGTLEKIVIEMPRDSNEKEEKDRITKTNKDNKNRKKKVIEKAQQEYGFNDEAYRNQNDLNSKLNLWYQQGQKCLYSGRTIKVFDLITNPHLFDIDHIIPKSISYDDSLNNKVLCYATENRDKGNLIPYRYFKRKVNLEWNYETYKSYIIELYNDGKGELSRSKMELLLSYY